MSLELNAEQLQVLANEQGFPPRIRNPQTNETYVLIHAELYERIRAILEEEDEIGAVRETYPLVTKVLDSGEVDDSAKESA
jgi:hypothetical protein